MRPVSSPLVNRSLDNFHAMPDANLGDIDALFDNRLDCVKLLDSDGHLIRINACGVEALEIVDPSDALGTSYFEFWSGLDRDAALAAADTARRTGSGRFSGTYVSPSGKKSIWDEVITVLEPDDAGSSGFLVVSRDVTQLRTSLLKQKATAELGMLALRDVGFQDLLDAIVDRLSVELHCPLTKVLQFADDADELTLIAGVGWQDGLVGSGKVGVDLASQAGFTLKNNGPVVVEDLETETRFDGPPLLREHGVRSGMSVTIPGPGNRPFGVLGVHTTQKIRFDQSDVDFLVAVAGIIASRWRQEQAEANNRMLLREMAHRSGNLLQVVNSIFSSTMRTATNVEDARSKFAKRLAAMARANLLLSRGGWVATSLRELAEDTLEPFGRNLALEGPDMLLPGEVAFDLSLIWFELGTNSAKYGAFGPGDGEVHLSWRLYQSGTQRTLKLTWKDTSAPCTSGAIGSGFGSRLIRQIIEIQYEGAVRTLEAPRYECELTLNLPAYTELSAVDGKESKTSENAN